MKTHGYKLAITVLTAIALAGLTGCSTTKRPDPIIGTETSPKNLSAEANGPLDHSAIAIKAELSRGLFKPADIPGFECRQAEIWELTPESVLGINLIWLFTSF